MFRKEVEQLLSSYGYAAAALIVLLESAGIPVPGETALIAAGFLAARGILSLPVVILVCGAAGILGDNLGYFAGRRWGRPWLRRHGHHVLFTKNRMKRMDRFFDRFGPAAVALARFVVGLRVVAAVAAGIAKMRWSVFLPYNALGGILWATAMGLVGYLIGEGYSTVRDLLGPLGVGIAVVIPGILVAVWFLARHRRSLLAKGDGGDDEDDDSDEKGHGAGAGKEEPGEE